MDCKLGIECEVRCQGVFPIYYCVLTFLFILFFKNRVQFLNACTASHAHGVALTLVIVQCSNLNTSKTKSINLIVSFYSYTYIHVCKIVSKMVTGYTLYTDFIKFLFILMKFFNFFFLLNYFFIIFFALIWLVIFWYFFILLI